MKNLATLLTAVIVLCISCSGLRNDHEKSNDIAAQVNDKVLYRSDISGFIAPGATKEDSIKITKNFVESWVRQQVVLLKAEANLKDDSVFSSLEKQLADYRSSLIRFAYEKELVRQKLDTAVSKEEIEQYYNNNKNNFELKDNIIKVIYLKLSKKAPKLNKVREWYKSENAGDQRLLEDYCHQYAENFYLDSNTWLLFDDLLKEIPIKTYDTEQYLKNNRFIEIEDANNIFFVNIKGFKIKNSLSPLAIEQDNIVNIILNKRKLKLIEDMEKSAYQEALNHNKIVIY